MNLLLRRRPFEPWRGLIGIALSLMLLSACGGSAAPQPGPTAVLVPLDPAGTDSPDGILATLVIPDTAEYGYTYHSPDGNRFVDGSGALPEIVPMEIEIGFTPAWIVGVPVGVGSLWAAVSDQGEAVAVLIDGGRARRVSIDADDYLPGQPPLLGVQGERVKLVGPAEGNSSGLTHAVVLHGDDAIVWLDEGGRLHLQADGDDEVLDVQALPDARLLQDEHGRLLFLSEPSRAYDHGVLGDSVEAGGITLIETTPKFRIVKKITMPDGLVIEGIMPLWYDLNADGMREIIVTASDRAAGARLLVYSEVGDLIAQNEPIGQGYRWLHQIAVVSNAPGEPAEIVSVRTPHIGGVLEYFRLSGDRLDRVATVTGVSSHVIGTRNLDLALTGDFNGDGAVEVLLPDSSRRQLVAVQRSGSGAAINWSLPLTSALSSNLAATADDQGRISVAAGLENGTLWIWSP